MKTLINLTFILVFTLTYSQQDSLLIDSIRIKSFKIDSTSKRPINTKKKYSDSIKISFKTFKEKIEVTSHFTNSKSELKTVFYFENNDLILARFSEQGQLYKDDNAIRVTEFFYECEELIGESFYTILPSTAFCMGIPIDKDWNLLYGFNKSFTTKFLNSYSSLLLSKLKED